MQDAVFVQNIKPNRGNEKHKEENVPKSKLD